jgi:dihydrofolate synthase/folylpolyglutamate synthase
MLVDSRPIPATAFASWTEELAETIEQTGASFFEATTAIALADFAARGAEIAVVEVGLGGRLDSTNVLCPVVSCVTQVGREHTDYLGESLEAIAREKAGIAKSRVPFVVGEPDERLAHLLAEAAARTGAVVNRVAGARRYAGTLRLRGAHQRRNAAVAEAILQNLPEPFRPGREALERGFAKAYLPGRLDLRGKWLFDVAHNPQAIDALVAGLGELRPPRPLHALVGILRDKDWKTMLASLETAVDTLWVTHSPTAPTSRRWDLNGVLQELGIRIHAEPDFNRALEQAQVGARTVLVTGSFHTVGDAMARLPGFAPLG